MKIVSIYDFFQKFPDEEAARLYLEKKRWNGSIVCPHCGSHKVSECKIISRCLIDAKNAENIFLLELERF